MNDNERWLRELAQVANDEKQAEEALLDPRWDRLSAGDLSPDEEAALRALAGASEEGRTAYEAFRPLGPEFQARVVQALRDQNAQRSPAPVPEPVPDPPAPVLSFRRRARRISAWLGSVAAAAAVLFLGVRWLGSPAPLPGYGPPQLSGGVQAKRDLREGPGVFVSGSTFDLVLTPQTAVSGKVDVRCFLERGAELRPLPVPEVAIQNVGGGVLKIHGTVGREIVIPPGAWTLWAVVGRPRALPPDAETLRARLARGRPRGRGWEALKIGLKAE